MAGRKAELSRQALEVVEPLLEAGASYTEVSVERVLQGIGISRSTFYVYFEDKGDLLQAMTVDVTADFAAAGARWFAFPPDGTREQLRDALGHLFATYRRHRAVLGAVAETAAYDARVRDGQALLVQTAVTGLADHIRGIQDAGGAAVGLDAERTAEWLTAMLERGLLLRVAHAATEEAEALLDSATELAWRLLYASR